MEKQKRTITLGFTEQKFKPGVHICQIFNDEEERHSSLISFIISGIKTGEKTSCFTEKETKESLTSLFEKEGISYKELESSGDFTLSKTYEVYFKNDQFDPDRMIDLLREFYQSSVEKKNSGARVIGEMTPDVQHVKGGSRLLEYESKVSLLLKDYPVTAVCQYDAHAFNGATIMDILKVHPYMIVKGTVIHNPFFITPKEFLKNIKDKSTQNK